MSTKNTIQTFVIALAMMFTLTVGSSMIYGQDTGDKQSIPSLDDEQGIDLTGVWEEVAPATVDCQTGLPNGPIIRILYTFHQGGTMYEEDTLPEDRYRTTGGGIWKRALRRSYTYGNLHYAFAPDGTFLFTIKQKSNLTLSRNGNSFTEKGTFEAVDPNGHVLFNGCFAAAAHRIDF